MLSRDWPGSRARESVHRACVFATPPPPVHVRLSSVSLVLPDGEQVQGTVRGVDPGSDLAAVSFASGTLPVAGRAAGASPRVDDVVCAVGRDPSGLTHASFGHIGLVAGEWRTWRGGRVDRLIRLDGGLCPGLDGAPVADASGQVLGAKPHMLRHAPISEVGTVPVVEPRGQQPSYDVQGAAAPVRRARRPQVRVRPPRAAAFRQSAVVNLVDATAAMQRKEPVAARGRTHGECQQADVGLDIRYWSERRLYEVQLTAACDWAIAAPDDCSRLMRAGRTDPMATFRWRGLTGR